MIECFSFPLCVNQGGLNSHARSLARCMQVCIQEAVRTSNQSPAKPQRQFSPRRLRAVLVVTSEERLLCPWPLGDCKHHCSEAIFAICGVFAQESRSSRGEQGHHYRSLSLATKSCGEVNIDKFMLITAP